MRASKRRCLPTAQVAAFVSTIPKKPVIPSEVEESSLFQTVFYPTARIPRHDPAHFVRMVGSG